MTADPDETNDPDPAQSEDFESDPHIDAEADDYTHEAPFSAEALEAVRNWRVAASLETLLAQVDQAFPQRRKQSDGTIGDARHLSRRSDHNPHVIDGGVGVVTALDITHDPENGADAGRIVAAIRGSQDPRVSYVIWNRKIANASAIGGAAAWQWRAYTGSNPHDKHCHISVKPAKALYDDTRPWTLPAAGDMEAAVAGAAEEDAETLIRSALAAIGGADSKPLLQALVDAQDAIAVLLARNAEEEWPRAIEENGVEAAAPGLDQLRQNYLDLWSSLEPRPEHAGAIAFHRRKLLAGRARYEEAAARTGTLWWFVGIVHALEASFNFNGHLHNGDPLTRRTVHVPRGRPPAWNPPSDWVSSAVDAIIFEGNSGENIWRLPEVLYRFERYNGFGYRPRGINSPYLWSFSNHYTRGKFVSDGSFSASAVSKQCGAAVILKALVDAGDAVVEL